MEKTKILIKEEVNRTPSAKTCMISLSVNKSFLAKHLFNDNGDDNVELLKGKQLEYI